MKLKIVKVTNDMQNKMVKQEEINRELCKSSGKSIEECNCVDCQMDDIKREMDEEWSY